MTLEALSCELMSELGEGVGGEVIKSNQKAFSLIELLFVIAIISLLAALLFPVFERAREQGRAAVCFSNMRQMGTSVLLYLQDYDETYPMNRMPDETHPLEGCKLAGTSEYPIGSLEDSRLNWRRVIQPYLKSKQAMVCPSNPYALNSPFLNTSGGDQNEPVLHPQRLPPALLRLQRGLFPRGGSALPLS